MNGHDRVRHCAECKLNVYNLSDMTRAEADRLIANREGRLCIRFYRRSDGTIITRDCPRGLQAMIRGVSRIAGAALSAMMAVMPVYAQSHARSNPPDQAENKDSELGLDVTVVDPTGALVPNAKVTLCRCKGKAANDTSTDASGVARFRNLPKGTYEINVQAKGFRKNQQNVTIKKTEQLQVKLQIAVQTTTIEVKASPVEIIGITTVGVLATIDQPFPPMVNSPGRLAPLRR
ncbi:MAG TPA: carboxypeptidase-like regulatory domain-containing protein [Candidatus Angelobacter sp.]